MENIDNIHFGRVDRDGLAQTLKVHKLDRHTESEVARFLNQEMEGSGLSDPLERYYFGQFKKAELYFDAGFKGEAMMILTKMKKEADNLDKKDFVDNLSKDLQNSIDNM